MLFTFNADSEEKKAYQNPFITIYQLNQSDVITTSGNVTTPEGEDDNRGEWDPF